MNKLFNHKIESRPVLLLAFVTIVGLFLSGCASTPTSPESSEDVLLERAENRWATLLAGDYETAYSYYSPGYRSTKSLVDFTIEMRSRKVRWTSAEYRKHDCTENSCSVTFDVGYRVIKPVPGLDKWDGSSLIDETWINTGGEWWFIEKKK